MTESETETKVPQNNTITGNGILLSASSNNTEAFDDSDPRTTIIRILLDAGADANKIINHEYYSLMMAGTLPVVTALLEAGADVNAVDSKGNSPLYYALFWPSVDAVAALIDAGADINAKNKNGDTPFMLAINRNANSGSMLLMIDRGVDINTQDAEGSTLLMDFAARGNIDPELIILLLDKGADAKIKKQRRKTRY